MAIALATLSVTSTGVAQSPKRIQALVQHYAERDGFSGTVTVAHAGKVIFNKGYGYADLHAKIGFDDHMRLSIGSITKQFTATAILLLQQDGKLKTSDRLEQLLPADLIPKSWSEITVRQLLSHTSGLKDYANAAGAESPNERTPAELLAIVRDAPLDATPGEKYSYSNTNYLLLGQIVQRAAGVPYCAFLHKRIFDPLGMRDTQCVEETGAMQRRAKGYAPNDPGDGKPVTDAPLAAAGPPSFFFGAGNIVSNGPDLARWTDALHHGRVLSASSYAQMTTPVRDGYGYGLNIGTLRGHMRIDHSGSVPGFYSNLEYFPETDNTIVVLSNRSGLSPQYSPGTHVIDSELMSIAAEPNAPVPSERKERRVSPRTLRLFTGRYVSDDGKLPPVNISLVGDHLQLLMDGPGHSPSQLRGDYGEVDFYFSDSEADLEFSGQGQMLIFDLRYSRALMYHRETP